MFDDPFPGWGLRPVELHDQAILNPYLSSLSHPLSDYTFSQIFTWRNSLRLFWTELEGHLCVFANGSGDLTLLLPPIGSGNGGAGPALRCAFELMDDYNAAHGASLDNGRVEYASEELLARLDRGQFDIRPMGHDYVYDVQRMIDLAGGDLKSKRQERNRFMRDQTYRVEPYDPDRHLSGCLDLLHAWKAQRETGSAAAGSVVAMKRQKEALAAELALRHAGELVLSGMVVHVGDRIAGFTLGEALSPAQSSIVVEKTDLNVKGLAQFIFSEFCARCWCGRPLVNVGDDWGVPTLAWTKMSYRPVQLLPKFVLTRVAAISSPTGGGPALAAAADAPPALPVVRRAREGDVAAIAELERSAFTAYCLSKRQLRYLLASRSAAVLVAERDGKIVGEGVALVRHNRRGVSGRIYSLAVRQDCRGQQIGRRLLDAMLEDLSRRGVRRVYLEVEAGNAGAIALYERAGFRRISSMPDYYGPGRPALHMLRETESTRTIPAAA